MHRKNVGRHSNDNMAMESLDDDTQNTLLRAFEQFYEQESEIMLTALNESREELKNSLLELCVEQDKYKDQLNKGKHEVKRKKGSVLIYPSTLL